MGTYNRCAKKSIKNSQLFVKKMKNVRTTQGGDFFDSHCILQNLFSLLSMFANAINFKGLLFWTWCTSDLLYQGTLCFYAFIDLFALCWLGSGKTHHL